MWLLLGVAALAIVVALLLWRRHRAASRADDVFAPAPPASTTPPTPAPEAPAPPAATPAAAPPIAPTPTGARAWIELGMTPRRAGLNLLTATVDMDVLVRNTGDAAASDIRVDARLVSASADQDAALGALFAEAVQRPAAPPFTLEPGAERIVRALVTLPRASIHVLTAGGRPMFVPVVAVNARYGSSAGPAQTANAWAIGVERAGAAKLGPFWLDVPARMHEAIAARPHALALRS